MKQITFLSFNNYQNRQIKYKTTYMEYVGTAPYLYPYYFNVYRYNFKYANGVETEVTVNMDSALLELIDWAPDYAVVFDNDTEAPVDDYAQPESRWFVMEWYKNRDGQYVASLKRDVITDHYEDVMTAPAFLEKGFVNDPYNPLLYNSENNSFNQIKQSEKLIKDETGVAWVVGYIPRDAFQTDTVIHGTSYTSRPADITIADIHQWQPYQYTTTPYQGYLQPEYIQTNYFAYTQRLIYKMNRKLYNYARDGGAEIGQQAAAINGLYVRYADRYVNIYQNVTPTMYSNWTRLMNNDLHGPVNNSYEDYLYALNGRIIKDTTTNISYEISVTREDNTYETALYNATVKSQLYNAINPYVLGSPEDDTFQVKITVPYYTVHLNQISTDISVTIPASSTRLHLSDAPYDMFCIPYGEMYMYGAGYSVKTSQQVAVDIAQAIQTQAGSGNLYDLQLLPYCPARYCITPGTDTFYIPVATGWASAITDQNNSYVSYMIWCSESNLEFRVAEEDIALSDMKPKSLKIDNETKLYRLCDPSYSNYFDFSLSKNGGYIGYWNIDCTYKPYTPYVHVAPDFRFMYGSDFNDCRGLICSGEFSLPQITSAWADYQLQNKNYNEIFKRQIQNIDVNRKYERINDIASAITGAISGAGSGLSTSYMAGAGPVGMAASAAISGGLSAAAGAYDIYAKEKLFQENKSFTIDKYNFELGNIQAIPYGLSKVSAFTANNKLFPFIEIYEASEPEIEALDYQIDYQGMTLMVIGKIEDYMIPGAYVKGRLLRLDPLSVHEDDHMVSAINIELDKGVYFD